MTLHIKICLCLQDNIAVLIHNPATLQTLLIDAPESEPIQKSLHEAGWPLTHILITHKHHDHIGGLTDLVNTNSPNPVVYGPQELESKIPPSFQKVAHNDVLSLLGTAIHVMATPGHTKGHVIYHWPEQKWLFAGDALFRMGCGRQFEAPDEELWSTLKIFKSFPDETNVYCGHHSYIKTNIAFAKTLSPNDTRLSELASKIDMMIAANQLTVPFQLGEEKQQNPFLRADDVGWVKTWAPSLLSADDACAELRRRRNQFA